MSQYQTTIRYRYTTHDEVREYASPVIDAPDMTTATAQAMVSFFYVFEIGHVKLAGVRTERLTRFEARLRTAIYGSTLFGDDRTHVPTASRLGAYPVPDDYGDWELSLLGVKRVASGETLCTDSCVPFPHSHVSE